MTTALRRTAPAGNPPTDPASMDPTSALADRPVSAAALDALRGRLTGVALTPDDPGYLGATRVWNAAAVTRPRVVVRCAHDSDVVAALRFARDQQLPVAVRSGGWHPAGHGTGPGIVLDLRSMARVRVDPLGGTALVGGGATWGAVQVAAGPSGRAVPGLAWPGVGVAGATLGGGFGEFRRAYGLVCDSLIGADVVLADGSAVSTSGDERPELLWGLRGGGGNFGVVTALRFRLRPVPVAVLAGTVWFPAASAPALLRWYRDFTADLAPELSTRLSLFGAGHPAVPPALAGAPVIGVFAAVAAPPGPGEALVAPLRAAGPVAADDLGPRRTVAVPPQAAGPPDAAAAVDSWFVAALPDDLLRELAERHAAMPRGAAELHLHHLGGAIVRTGAMSTAVPHRTSPYLVTGQTRWWAPGDEPAARSWLLGTAAAVRPQASGGPHPGFTSEPRPAGAVYGAHRYLRLAALKRHYDPDNVFAGNQNVEPLA